jgi:hypothetical protein
MTLQQGPPAPPPRRGAILARALLAAGMGWAPAPIAAAGQADVAMPPPRQVWLGPSGAPLPFANDDEVLDFLQTARVVSRKTLGEGINHEQKLLLERDGIQAHAIFRTVHVELRRRRVAGRYYVRFLDDYAHECAAYRLARRLGLDDVPPAVLRRIDSTPGSVQIWVEGARDETAAGFRPAHPMAWVKQVWDRILLDLLILNVDRNPGNVLAGPDYHLWLIDHGRAFEPQGVLLEPDALRRVNRRAWEQLRALSDQELKDLVRGFLDAEQLDALVARRARLAERVERLVSEHGEAAVFY